MIEPGCHAPADVSDCAQTLYLHLFRGCAVWKMLLEIGVESRRQGSGAGASDGLIRANSNSDVRMEPGSGDGGGVWIQEPGTCGRRGLVVSVGLLSFGLLHVVIGATCFTGRFAVRFCAVIWCQRAINFGYDADAFQHSGDDSLAGSCHDCAVHE